MFRRRRPSIRLESCVTLSIIVRGFLIIIINPGNRSAAIFFKWNTSGSLPLNSANHISIQTSPLQYFKAMCSPGFNHTPSIGQHLHAPNFQHRPIIIPISRIPWSGSHSRGHNHPKARIRTLQAPSQHEPISRLEKVQQGWHAGERQLTDKDGRI